MNDPLQKKKIMDIVVMVFNDAHVWIFKLFILFSFSIQQHNDLEICYKYIDVLK